MRWPRGRPLSTPPLSTFSAALSGRSYDLLLSTPDSEMSSERLGDVIKTLLVRGGIWTQTQDFLTTKPMSLTTVPHGSWTPIFLQP